MNHWIVVDSDHYIRAHSVSGIPELKRLAWDVVDAATPEFLIKLYKEKPMSFVCMADFFEYLKEKGDQ